MFTMEFDFSRAMLLFSLAGLTPRMMAKLMTRYPDAVAAAEDLRGASSLLPARTAQHLENALGTLDSTRDALWKCGTVPLYLGTDEYPSALAEIDDAPLCLLVRGEKSALSGRLLGIVGTRAPSEKGIKWTEDTAHALSKNGVTVVSGLARGIDGAAHRGCIKAGGATVAVMGTGPDIIYPQEHDELAAEIIRSGGCLVTEYFPGTQPDRTRFPRRNRIIAALSAATVMVEGQAKSGGMITMSYCEKYGRTRFAVPGMVGAFRSEGPHQVIRSGGRLVTCADDILTDMDWQAGQLSFFPQETASSPVPAADSVEETLLFLLDGQNKTLDEMIASSGATPEDVQTALVMIELTGSVARRAGGYYEKL